MKKAFSSNSQLAHAWANQTHPEGRGSSMFFEGEVIYSYGHHYEIARLFGGKYCFVNSNGYSNSTAKHTRHVLNAIPANIETLCIPFIDNKFKTSNIGGIVEKIQVECESHCKNQLKAREIHTHFSAAEKSRRNIEKLCKIFGIELPELPANWNEAKEKAERLAAEADTREAERETKRKAREAASLIDWLNHERSQPIYGAEVHLRYSNCGDYIETTQGARVRKSSALNLLDKLKSGENVQGYKIDGFTLLENNADHVKIGCHVIKWNKINQFFNL